jgi:hypothetical protein
MAGQSPRRASGETEPAEHRQDQQDGGHGGDSDDHGGHRQAVVRAVKGLAEQGAAVGQNQEFLSLRPLNGPRQGRLRTERERCSIHLRDRCTCVPDRFQYGPFSRPRSDRTPFGPPPYPAAGPAEPPTPRSPDSTSESSRPASVQNLTSRRSQSPPTTPSSSRGPIRLRRSK